MTQSNKSGYPIALSTGQWQVVNRLLTVIFLVDSNPPFEQLGPYTALEAHYKPLLPRQIRPRRRLCASSWCQTMNRGETKNTTWEGQRERSLSAPPQPFSCLTSVKLFSHLHYSCIFLQNTSEKHAKKKPAGDLPTFCPLCHGPTKTSKVWVQTNIFCCKAEWLDLVIRNTFTSVNALIAISICEAENSFLKLLSLAGDYNSSFCIPRRNSSESKYQHIAWLCRLELLEADELSLLPQLLCKR